VDLKTVKMRRFFFIGFILMLVAVGCSPRVAPYTTTEKSDSTSTKVKPRLIDLDLPKVQVTAAGKIDIDAHLKWIDLQKKINDKAFAHQRDSLLNLIDKLNKSEQRIQAKSKDGAFVDVHVKPDGSVIATGGKDSTKTQAQVFDTETYREKKTDTKKLDVRTEYKTTGFDIFCRWYLVITLVSALVFTYLKFKARP
jgi:hypothetical protein